MGSASASGAAIAATAMQEIARNLFILMCLEFANFGEPHALATTLLDALTPSEVNQVQNPTTGLQGGGVVSLNLQNKHAVASGASLIAQGLCLGSCLASPSHHVLHMRLVQHFFCSQICHHDIRPLRVGHFHLVLKVFFHGQQIPYLLVVDFKERRLQFVFPVLLLQSVLRLKYLPDSPWDHALVLLLATLTALHGEGLSTSRLPIGEDTNVVPIQGTLDQLRKFLEDFGLTGLWSKHPVELKVVPEVLVGPACPGLLAFE